MGIYRIYEEMELPASLDEVWDFISRPENLKEITPPSMGFHVTTPELPARMYPGMIISYIVSPIMRIPMTWVTEITHIKEKAYFVDEQRIGPYTMWHHEHFVEVTPYGVKMTDIVSYKLPLGWLGRLGHRIMIRKQLKEIFLYRRKKLESLFGKI